MIRNQTYKLWHDTPQRPKDAAAPHGRAALVCGGSRAMQVMDNSAATEEEDADALLMRVAGRAGGGRDRMAFQALFRRFAPRLKSFLMKAGVDAPGAEEIIQDVMTNLWRQADKFDPQTASAATWIFAMARNRRIDWLRKERRPEIDWRDPALVWAEAGATEEGGVIARQEAGRLKQAMDTLPPEQAELLRLAYFHDKSHVLIAQERNLPLGTVKSRLRLALRRMRSLLDEEGR
jgi:RNA polymerase sigma factor (sigma-70 family)